jgi:glycosyltransferase involved in cell wall biosynthesis
VSSTGIAPRADVVICTYTLARWGLLVRGVESVLAQSVTPHQLIIAVDHNDELVQRCRQEWGAGRSDSSVEVAVVANRFAGRKGSALNSALLHARSDIVVFLDDDAEPAPDWLERLLAVYVTHPEAVAVGCKPVPNYEAPRPSWFPPDFDWVFGCHYRSLPDRLAPARRLIGTSLSARRDAVLAVGGFHHDDHDDMDLSHRIAHRHGPAAVLYEPRAEVRHHVPADRMTWSYFWRRCYYGNQCKADMFADLSPASSVAADLRFGLGVLWAVFPASLAALTGRREPLIHALVGLVGLVLAGCGLLVGRVQYALGRREKLLTTGLDPTDVARARTGVWAADDA